jgi:uncharacterized protein YbjT (DUF2867 family)
VQLELHEADRLMRIIARVVATSPAGVGLHLIGGFRYRLLDGSQRFSVDIDYHWAGDLDAKQQELLALCRRVILRQVALHPDSPARLKSKVALLPLGPEAIAGRLRDLMENRDYHASAIQKVIDEQVDPIVAQHIHAGGGGRAVLESALSLILRVCPP